MLNNKVFRWFGLVRWEEGSGERRVPQDVTPSTLASASPSCIIPIESEDWTFASLPTHLSSCFLLQ